MFFPLPLVFKPIFKLVLNMRLVCVRVGFVRSFTDALLWLRSKDLLQLSQSKNRPLPRRAPFPYR